MLVMVLRWKCVPGDRCDVLAAPFTSVYSGPWGGGTRLVDLVECLMVGLREILGILVECRHRKYPLRLNLRCITIAERRGRELNPRC